MIDNKHVLHSGNKKKKRKKKENMPYSLLIYDRMAFLRWTMTRGAIHSSYLSWTFKRTRSSAFLADSWLAQSLNNRWAWEILLISKLLSLWNAITLLSRCLCCSWFAPNFCLFFFGKCVKKKGAGGIFTANWLCVKRKKVLWPPCSDIINQIVLEEEQVPSIWSPITLPVCTMIGGMRKTSMWMLRQIRLRTKGLYAIFSIV